MAYFRRVKFEMEQMRRELTLRDERILELERVRGKLFILPLKLIRSFLGKPAIEGSFTRARNPTNRRA